MSQAVKIDVYSDISCPWCWVGKKRLDKALQQLEGTQVEVVYHSYIIDHNTDPAGEDYLAYNRRRWGSDGWTADLRRRGAPDGASFSDWRWWPSSQRAHALLQYAQARGRGRQAKDLLLQWTYEQGENVSGVDTLVRLAQQLGLDGGEVRRHLEQDGGRQEVLRQDSAAKRELGISGVPYFIVGPADSGSDDGGNAEGAARRYALSGAQPASAIAQAVRRVLAAQQAA